jgi:Flp pilus assembly protein TadD
MDDSNDGQNVQLDQAVTDIFNGKVASDLGLDAADLEVALEVANNQLKNGKAHEAVRMYAVLTVCSPREVKFHAGLANCAIQMQEYALALHAASAIVALEPSNPRGYYFSGAACLGLGHKEEAEEDLQDAMDFARKSSDSEIFSESMKLMQRLNMAES